MARRPRLFSPGLLYHVIVRGNHRQRTFRSEQDYKAYFERLARYRQKYGVTLYAYCLMPNHVHLLLESSKEPLSRFMQGLQQSYTQYFNRVHHKAGHLFQGRYKAIVCDKDEYLLSLVRYIHLNPVRAKLVAKPERYRYSGHRAYLEGKGNEVTDPGPVLKLLGGRGAYGRFVLEGLGEGHREEYYELQDQRFLGAQEFGEKLKKEVEGTKPQVLNKPLGRLVQEMARHLKIEPEILRAPERGWKVSRIRTLVVYTLVRRMGYSVNEVAAYLRRDATTLSSLVSRLSARMGKEPEVGRELERLSRIV